MDDKTKNEDAIAQEWSVGVNLDRISQLAGLPENELFMQMHKEMRESLLHCQMACAMQKRFIESQQRKLRATRFALIVSWGVFAVSVASWASSQG